MAGGSFTISNGGTFGSLMGTPIINPPQSAILGMHATKMRPVVVNVCIYLWIYIVYFSSFKLHF
jgi:pyruvate/2-oxoglutarate dehydrogenase complex dihydrolipoamide acyltransferase (E2) component